MHERQMQFHSRRLLYFPLSPACNLCHEPHPASAEEGACQGACWCGQARYLIVTVCRMCNWQAIQCFLWNGQEGSGKSYNFDHLKRIYALQWPHYIQNATSKEIGWERRMEYPGTLLWGEALFIACSGYSNQPECSISRIYRVIYPAASCMHIL